MVKWHVSPIDTQKMTSVLAKVAWLWTEKHIETLSSLPSQRMGLRPSNTPKDQ